MGYYIKGNPEKGKEILKLLKSKGGNINSLRGDAGYNSIYYIDKNNNIQCTKETPIIETVKLLCEELTLPEKPKFKIGDKVICAFSNETGEIIEIHPDRHFDYNVKLNGGGYQIFSENSLELYEWKPKFKLNEYVIHKVSRQVDKIIGIDHKNHTYLLENLIRYASEENLTLWEPKRGETVLVTESYVNSWEEAVFSYKTNGSYHMVGGGSWTFCIPFDESKLGKK